MERIKIYAASAVFLFLTAIKLLFPSHAEMVRSQIHSMIDHNDDYAAMVQTLGRRLSDNRWGDELVAALGIEKDKTLPEKTQETAPAESERESETEAEDYPAPAAEPAEEEKAPEEEKETEGETEMSEAEEAFLAEQAQYEDMVMPANVRTDKPELPFTYSSPVSGYESSGFGFRLHPIDGEISFHYGTDFAANSGDNVSAFADGYVYAAGYSDGYGNYLILTHGEGYCTIYGHLSAFTVEEGDMVTQGQLIGYVGQTGKATGPHLHFELLCDDVYINPEYYL